MCNTDTEEVVEHAQSLPLMGMATGQKQTPRTYRHEGLCAAWLNGGLVMGDHGIAVAEQDRPARRAAHLLPRRRGGRSYLYLARQGTGVHPEQVDDHLPQVFDLDLPGIRR